MRDVPAWLVGIVLVVGLPVVMLTLDVLLHRAVPHRRLARYNVVTGVIVSVVGVAYAIIIGQCVVSLWAGINEAEDTVSAEAANLAGLVPVSRVFGTATQHLIADEIIRYQRDLVDEWHERQRGEPGSRGSADLDRLVDTVESLRPTTTAQQAFVTLAVDRIDQGRQLRQRSLAEAEDRQMSTVMWIGVLGTTAAILCLCLFFGLDDSVLRRVLLSLSSAVIATNLFLIVQMNFPYYGSFSVTPAGYEQVIGDLRRDL